MNRVDLAAFESFMQELAEVYGMKPYTGPALKHWASALSEFSWDKVRYRLVIWRDSKPKLPMISDILPPLRDAVSDAIEAKALADKSIQYKALTPVTPQGIACMAKIREITSNKRHAGRWWAYELRDRRRSGVLLDWAQEELAIKACGSDWDTDTPYAGTKTPERAVSRNPGEDDE